MIKATYLRAGKKIAELAIGWRKDLININQYDHSIDWAIALRVESSMREMAKLDETRPQIQRKTFLANQREKTARYGMMPWAPNY